jgi:predicted HAD superfamily phosphohydrolase YqeG
MYVSITVVTRMLGVETKVIMKPFSIHLTQVLAQEQVREQQSVVVEGPLEEEVISANDFACQGIDLQSLLLLFALGLQKIPIFQLQKK